METSRSNTCTKKATKSTLNGASTTMAAKGKRAKVTSTKSGIGGDQASGDPREVIAHLESELEVERRSNTQLRREKAREVQQVRDVEQNRSTSAQKDLTARLHLEKQRDLEGLRETLRAKHEADMLKAIRQKDAEIKRLQRDLLRSQDELKEEVAKRGLSTSARNAFELERAKMLQEIKELTSAKRQLEDALRSAADAEKVRIQEVRQTKETCKLEVAKVEKEAAMEVRKLLEELKSKDHLLAQMDRNQYPDRSNSLRQHLANQSVDELLKISTEIEAVETKATGGSKQEPVVMVTPPPAAAAVTGLQNITWQKKVYELEKQIRLASGLNHAFIEKNKEFTTINNSLESKIKNLADENKELNSELSSAKVEMKKMNDLFSGTSLETLTNQLERLKKQIKEQEFVIAQLRRDCQDKDRRLKKIGKPKKAVRFLLPGETVPRAPGFDIDDVIADGNHGDDHYMEDNADSMSMDSDATCQSSQPSDISNITDDDRELMEPGVLLENVEKDYELLMKEHLTLEQSYASLIHSYSVRNDGEPPPEEWKIERESLNLAIWALEQKVRRCEENEDLLRIKLEQVTEEKEELEFKVLEQEQEFDGPEVVEQADVVMLESELVLLRNKLDRYERGSRASERDVGLQCDVSSQVEEECTDEGVKVIGPLSAKNLSRLGLTSGAEEIENDSGSEMVMSFSTTASSGFDELASEADESIAVDATPVLKSVAEDGGRDGTEDGEKMMTVAIQNDSQNQPPSTKTEVTSTTNVDLPVDLEEKVGSNTDRALEMEETIRSFQALESTWKTTVEKLERQLHQSLMRERIIRDQVALVEEEKNRRISALQGQIDVLEDNETRLADTILALEDMALGVDGLPGAAEPVPTDELDMETEKLEASRKQLKDQVEQLVEAGRMLGQVKVKYSDEVTVDDAAQRSAAGMETEVVGLVEAVETALRNSIRHLENVNDQMDVEARKERELGQRIQHLETNQVDAEETVERRKECPPNASAEVRKAVMECAQIMSAFAVEELQTDLKELRTLLIKLKAVIDTEEIDGKVKVDERLRSSGNKELRERLQLDVVQPMEEWMTITPPGVKVFGEFCDRDQDTTDYELRQKVDELEKECERLQSLVHEEDQVIRDLHFQNLELRDSEKNFQQLVERLESAEEQMHGKMEEMAEEMERLQGLVKVLEVKERMGRSQLMKHQENELELEEQLEQTVEEMQSGKRKSDRKIAELENEKKALVRRTEDQVDRIGDLEGLTGSLKLRIRNLEVSDSGLRGEIRKLESELCSAGGALAELEQQRDMLAQQVQDLEREKSNLLFEIADLTIDANKQGQKISLLNQEIGKLRGSIVNKDEVISCLQAKLDVAGTVLEALSAKVADYESNSLMVEERMEASVRERDQRIRNLEGELEQGREVKGCHQSTQTEVAPIRAKIIIEKATSAFRDSFLSLGDRHPSILREFLSASLLPLLNSYEASSSSSSSSTTVTTATVSKETMKRFIASLQVDFTSASRVQVALESSDEIRGKRRSEMEAEEERQWSAVEDPRIVHEVRTAENSNHWKNIESRMGLDTDDLALTIEFKDTMDKHETETPLSNTNQSLIRDLTVPPPLPTSSPPPLSPEPFAVKDEDAEESADEASEINDEDDGAVPQPCSDSFGPNWSFPHLSRHNDPSSPRQPSSKLVPQSSLDSQLDNRQFRSRSVDRDAVCGPLSRNTFQGTELSRIAAAGSVESITDSGMDSMQQGTSTFPRDTTTRHQKDQCTQADCDGEDEELRESSSSVIVLRTQLEQREKELSAKSNEMDRLSMELRRWQREAVAAGEEKSRLSALLGSALKDIKVMREDNTSITSPTSSSNTPTPTRVPKSPFGFISWGASAVASERPQPKTAAALLPSQIPVSTRLSSSSSTNEKDLAPVTKGTHQFPSVPNRRPASLQRCSSELSQSSSSSLTDDVMNSQSSPSQDRRPITTTNSHLPRPIKEVTANHLQTSSPVTSSKKEADRLFRQSFETSRPSSGSSKQSDTSYPCASGPPPSESMGDSTTGPLATAAEPTTSTTTVHSVQGATVF